MREALMTARKNAGKTQADVAEIVGIDRSYYAHIEKGKRSPALNVAIRIAECLGSDVGKLFLPTDVSKSHNKPRKAG